MGTVLLMVAGLVAVAVIILPYVLICRTVTPLAVFFCVVDFFFGFGLGLVFGLGLGLSSRCVKSMKGLGPVIRFLLKVLDALHKKPESNCWVLS